MLYIFWEESILWSCGIDFEVGHVDGPSGKPLGLRVFLNYVTSVAAHRIDFPVVHHWSLCTTVNCRQTNRQTDRQTGR